MLITLRVLKGSAPKCISRKDDIGTEWLLDFIRLANLGVAQIPINIVKRMGHRPHAIIGNKTEWR